LGSDRGATGQLVGYCLLVKMAYSVVR